MEVVWGEKKGGKNEGFYHYHRFVFFTLNYLSAFTFPQGNRV
jgi:hypothetical protein